MSDPSPGPQIGHAVRQWGRVRMFSPWEYNVDKAAERLLVVAGWNSPTSGDHPTGGELVAQYREPLAPTACRRSVRKSAGTASPTVCLACLALSAHVMLARVRPHGAREWAETWAKMDARIAAMKTEQRADDDD